MRFKQYTDKETEEIMDSFWILIATKKVHGDYVEFLEKLVEEGPRRIQDLIFDLNSAIINHDIKNKWKH